MFIRKVLTCLLGGVLVLWGTTAFAANGTLKVTSYPTGAEVFVDGGTTGKFTPMSVSLAEGDHEIVVQVPGGTWEPDIRTVTISPGNNDLSVTLIPTVIEGPPGPIGPAGPTGPQGSPGTDGANGADGADGAPGIGLPGLQGVQGPPGAQGLTGAAGPQGSTGAKGDTGPMGPAGVGVKGPTGPQGPSGPMGEQGFEGVQGGDGPLGPQGVQGPQGEPGPPGGGGSAAASFQYVGNTTATVQGSFGSARANSYCNQAHSGSRMCTTVEFAESAGSSGPLPPTWGWIRPVVISLGFGWLNTSNQPEFRVVDAVKTGFPQKPGHLSCFGWGNTQSIVRGTVVVAGSGLISNQPCDSYFAIACCAPAQ